MVSIRTALSIGLSVLIVQLLAFAAILVAFDDWQTRGQFGDLFGMVNALFSGLGFAGLVYAILLQREDLNLQKKSIADTQRELCRVAELQDKTREALTSHSNTAAEAAQLEATTTLLNCCRAERRILIEAKLVPSDPRYDTLKKLEQHELQLSTIIGSAIARVAAQVRGIKDVRNPGSQSTAERVARQQQDLHQPV